MTALFKLPEGAVCDLRFMPIDGTEDVAVFISLPDKTEDSVLLVGDKEYTSYLNSEEPYDKYADCFVVPRAALLANPLLRLETTSVFLKKQVFPAVGVRGTVTVKYEKSLEKTAEQFFREADYAITPIFSRDVDLADGLTYRRISCKDKNEAPVELFILIADSKKIGFATGLAGDGAPFTNAEGKTEYPISTVVEKAEQARAAGIPVLAATNADFFDIFGDFHPAGLCVARGKPTYEAPDLDRPFFGVLKDGTPVIATLGEHPEYEGNLEMAVSGSHIVLRDGAPYDLGFPEEFSTCRAPRTTVGLCPDGRVLLMVSDGRIPSYSQGTTLVDGLRIMHALGARDVINLDGGGSSTLFIYNAERDGFTLENRPADLDRPNDCLIRPIYNGILVYKK
ncbi:MAG: phosphodiester glycosidase family protein [Clostridia bacterium]|nr:phosphodiester glycosidase family protein [Clostridia bacterium]